MTKTVRLFPTAGFYISGVPAIEQDVTPERAEELLAYQPPAFTIDPPATEPTDLADAGSTDSEEPV